MIKVVRRNQEIFFINSDLIETIEETPDTVITTTTGKKFMVIESAEEVIQSIIEFKQKCLPNILNENNEVDN